MKDQQYKALKINSSVNEALKKIAKNKASKKSSPKNKSRVSVVPKTPVALITGAARRIGAEIAHILHENGFNVVLHYRQSKKEIILLCKKFNKKRPHSATIVQADLAQIADLTPLSKIAETTWGRLDVLVNNASCFYKTHVEQATEAEWDRLMTTNLKSIFFLSQALLPALKKQKGTIINIIDIHAERAKPDYSIYSVSKAGLRMLTKAMASELGPLVRVNAVSPGAIVWPEGSNAQSAQLKRKIVNQSALKRSGHPKEIAKAVLFLVKDADYITGQDIAVDGGRLLYMS